MTRRAAALTASLAMLVLSTLAMVRHLSAQEITTCQGAGCYGGGQSCNLEYHDAHGNTIFNPCPDGKP